MDKGDHIAVRAAARALIYEADASAPKPGELSLDVGDPVGDVVQLGWFFAAKSL
jgi:hypothetical protein